MLQAGVSGAGHQADGAGGQTRWVEADTIPKLVFEQLYEAFGGKLAHWQDFITDFGQSHLRSCHDVELNTALYTVNANGKLDSASLFPFRDMN